MSESKRVQVTAAMSSSPLESSAHSSSPSYYSHQQQMYPSSSNSVRSEYYSPGSCGNVMSNSSSYSIKQSPTNMTESPTNSPYSQQCGGISNPTTSTSNQYNQNYSQYVGMNTQSSTSYSPPSSRSDSNSNERNSSRNALYQAPQHDAGVLSSEQIFNTQRHDQQSTANMFAQTVVPAHENAVTDDKLFATHPDNYTMRLLDKPMIREYSVDSNIDIKLDQKDLWARFHHLPTEMIVTKSGRFVLNINQQFNYGNL